MSNTIAKLKLQIAKAFEESLQPDLLSEFTRLAIKAMDAEYKQTLSGEDTEQARLDFLADKIVRIANEWMKLGSVIEAQERAAITPVVLPGMEA